jgi:mRNA interferase MazF
VNPPARGRIYRVNIGDGLKPFLIVNSQLADVLAVRITTSVKPQMPSIVMLGPQEVVVGRVLCDDLLTLEKWELGDDLGALSRAAMLAVNQALKHALSIP